jgi:hypothetical protein
MKGERKLRLVGGGSSDPRTAGDPDLGEVTAEERAEAEALREALVAGTDPLACALAAAHAPRALAAADLDAILARALGDEAAATTEERAEAARLRDALEDPSAAPSEVAGLARALRAAAAPSALDPQVNEAIVQAALRHPVKNAVRLPRRIAPVTMVALASVAAMAAGVALFVGHAAEAPRGAESAVALLHARSAEDLFDAATPFPRRGEESSRMDRIASARTADLRNNRFAAWGVK